MYSSDTRQPSGACCLWPLERPRRLRAAGFSSPLDGAEGAPSASRIPTLVSPRSTVTKTCFFKSCSHTGQLCEIVRCPAHGRQIFDSSEGRSIVTARRLANERRVHISRVQALPASRAGV